MPKKRVGVVIGRFQTDELTEGHIALIKHVQKCNDDVCVLVGVAPKIDIRNLLPFECVASAIRDEFPGLFHVHPLRDIPGKDYEWSRQLDRFLELLFPFHEITLYGGRDSFKKHYRGIHIPVTEFTEFDLGTNATARRMEIINGRPEETAAFRRGVIYALGNFHVQTRLSVHDRQLQSYPLEATPPEHDNHL